jgi:hypothetical protein
MPGCFAVQIRKTLVPNLILVMLTTQGALAGCNPGTQPGAYGGDESIGDAVGAAQRLLNGIAPLVVREIVRRSLPPDPNQ